jgi:hypothetical protein
MVAAVAIDVDDRDLAMILERGKRHLPDFTGLLSHGAIIRWRSWPWYATFISQSGQQAERGSLGHDRRTIAIRRSLERTGSDKGLVFLGDRSKRLDVCAGVWGG